MEITHDMKLAAARATKREIDEIWKDADGAERDALLAAYAETGADRRTVRVGGVEVGKASVVTGDPVARIVPGREAEALAFLEAHGLVETVPAKGWQNAFANVAGAAVHAETGEVCDAIEYGPARAAYVRYTGFKRETVREAFQAAGVLNPAEVLLLEGGADE